MALHRRRSRASCPSRARGNPSRLSGGHPQHLPGRCLHLARRSHRFGHHLRQPEVSASLAHHSPPWSHTLGQQIEESQPDSGHGWVISGIIAAVEADNLLQVKSPMTSSSRLDCSKVVRTTRVVQHACGLEHHVVYMDSYSRMLVDRTSAVLYWQGACIFRIFHEWSGSINMS